MSVGERGLRLTRHTHLTADGKKVAWVDGFSINLNFIMQMRIGRSASVAHFANHRIFGNIIANLTVIRERCA